MLRRPAFYIIVSVVLLIGIGIYLTWAVLGEHIRGLITYLSMQGQIYGESIFRKISSSAWHIDPEPIPKADIHATILSILITALATYAVYFYSLFSPIEEQVFQEVNKINSLRFGGGVSAPIGGIYDSNDSQKRIQLVNRLVKLAMGMDSFDLPDDPSARGKEILSVIEALSRDYPFPKTFELTKEGGLNSYITHPLPIRFTTLEEVRQWVKDIELILWEIDWIRRYFLNMLIQTVEASYEDHLREYQDLPLPISKEIYLRQLEIFFRNTAIAAEIAHSVKGHLERIDDLRARRPEKYTLIFGLLLSGIAFLFGVMFPFFMGQVPTVFLIWIPSLIYTITFGYLIYRLFKV